MYFKRIDMHGFKSFAEPVSIEFHKGITCIVGPNGSGKSNISDAIRWVLGEQSPKMLRGGKMEEVIFSGTQNRKSRGMAEVTLVIDNTTGILPIDYTEVAIRRRMYRSGESEYSINSNPCRLRDIRELIMDTGIGVDGYSLIGQGKIADMVSNKPESRREIFEEAAGIVKYRSKREESERKLEASQNNLNRVNDIIVEIESRIGGLEEESKKAKEYLKLRDQYKELEVNITLKNIENIELKNEYIKDDLIELNHQIEEIRNEKIEIDSDIQKHNNRSEELETLVNKGRDKLLTIVESIGNLTNQSHLGKERLAAIEREKTRLIEEVSLLVQKINREEQNSSEISQAMIKVEEALANLEEDLNIKINNYSEMTGLISAKAKEIDEKKNKIYELHSTITNKTSEIASLENLRNTLDRRRQQIESEREEAADLNNNLSTQQKALSEENAVTQERLRKIDDAIKVLKSQFEEDSIKERKLARDYDELRISIGQASARKKMIEEMESSYEGYNNAVKFIMKSKTSGIHGVVAELIQVPKGFETAIETALGAALQNIICENEKSAQDAIDILKRNKAGRLTFLPLNSIKTSRSDLSAAMKKSQGFLGVGVECIRFDSKYQRVMDYLLGRVIVVDTLDNAVKLSKKSVGGLRFVTLDGDVINAGGAISGGAYRHKSTNLLERKAEAQELGEKLKVMEQTRAKAIKDIETLRTGMIDISAEIQKKEKEYHDIQLELLTNQNSLDNLKRQLADYHNSEAKWLKELDSIEIEVHSCQTMIEELKKAVDEGQKEIAEVESYTDADMAGYEKDKIQLEAANEEITKVKISLSATESEKNNLEQRRSRIDEQIKELTKEKLGKEKTLAELETQKDHLENSFTDLEAEITRKEAEKVALENYLMELQEEKVEASNYLNEITKKKSALEENLAKHQSQKVELEIKQAKNDTQLDTYKDRLWDEFEISYLQVMDFKKRDFVLSSAMKESREIKNSIKRLGEVNIGAIKEFEALSERYEFLTDQRNDISEAMSSLKKIIEDMDQAIKKNFKESFDNIVENFQIIFKELFGGGIAELKLDDETKPLECGIEIAVQPPGKRLQNINLMSGGEKTMTAIALMFAILKAKPTPFCILDEVEAALDDANVHRFARYLKTFEGIQFALVTHQRATMEYADILYGVTMPEQGISKIISLKLDDEFELE
ncbi:MAG: chromosome segregation protein SMC [Anaerovoracaceae bacterium]